jgi:enoyl-CoA hydratase
MSTVRSERVGAVETIWLDNPPYNFLTAEVMGELLALLTSLEGDPQVRAVVVTSAVQDVFVSHYDVSEILAGVDAAPVQLNSVTAAAALRASEFADKVPGGQAGMALAGARGVADLRRYHEVCALMRGSSKVFVAAINGRALGGGCELALSCDLRLMADGPFEIGQPEILVGLIPGGGGTQMLTRTLGAGRALELCLEGAPITPQEAERIGLVHRLVAPAELLAQAQATAAQLARRSSLAVAAVKRAVYEGGNTTLDKGLRIEQVGFLTSGSAPSAKKAMATYLAQVREVAERGEGLEQFVAQNLPRWVAGEFAQFD